MLFFLLLYIHCCFTLTFMTLCSHLMRPLYSGSVHSCVLSVPLTITDTVFSVQQTECAHFVVQDDPISVLRGQFGKCFAAPQCMSTRATRNLSKATFPRHPPGVSHPVCHSHLPFNCLPCSFHLHLPLFGPLRPVCRWHLSQDSIECLLIDQHFDQTCCLGTH